MAGMTLTDSDYLLIFPVFLFVLAAVYTYTGQAWVRGFRWIDRAKEPKLFWLVIAVLCLVGVGCIGYFLYKVYGNSN
jgi:hypothetical protein